MVDIGLYESLVFMASLLSFFWLSGITQGLLSIFREGEEEKPLIGSAFVAMLGMSLLAAVAFKLVLTPYSFISNNPEILYFGGPIFWFILLSGPAYMAEYILLLKQKSKALAAYSLVAYPAQFALVVVPIAFDFGLEEAINGLVYSSVIRFLVALFLVGIYGSFKIDLSATKKLLLVSWPLIIGTLLSGSAEYIDGLIVSRFFDEGTFAVYRYGAKEFPLFMLVAAAFSNAQVNLIAQADNLKEATQKVMQGAKQMINWFFPVAILLTIASPWLFKTFFNPEFSESALVFNAYLLTLGSRMLFPQTILVGCRQTKVVMQAAGLEVVLNVLLSLAFVNLFGLVGIAYATVLAYVFEKLLLTFQVHSELGLKPTEFIPFKSLLVWGSILLVIHIAVVFMA